MFVRPTWKPNAQEEIYALIEENPWALLVSNGPDGPFATDLPILLDRSRGPNGVLVSHIARANAHAEVILSASTPALCIFHGPYSYVTSSWYPNRDMPPTIYYTAVHCYGRVSIQNNATLRRWLETLTNRMEAPFSNGWKTSEIPERDITRRLSSIVGFEVEIERLEGKFKLGQDEPKKDALAVAERLLQSKNPLDVILGQMTLKYNAGRQD
jgi:transcriptional regulator